MVEAHGLSEWETTVANSLTPALQTYRVHSLTEYIAWRWQLTVSLKPRCTVQRWKASRHSEVKGSWDMGCGVSSFCWSRQRSVL